MSSVNLTRDEARRRGELLSDLRYTVDLDLTAGSDRFGVEATISFACSEPGAETFIEFHGPWIHTLELNGQRFDPSERFDGRRISLPPLAGRNELRIVADGAYQRNGIGMHRAFDPVDGETYLYSDAEPYDIHRVYPCFDQPDLKGRFTFTVRAPAGWKVASNTAPVSQPDDGKPGVWTFPETAPMSTYITCIAAGPYHVVRQRHGDIELGLWCRQTMTPYLEADEIFEVTKQGFDFYAEAFDYPYPFGKYDQLFVPEFNSGAMENIGCVTFHEDFLFRSKVTDAARERRAEVILHEMAHMWFGNLVTMRWWDDLWLNESFASWAAVYSQASATRWRNAWVTFADSEKTWAYRQDQLASTHPIVADIPDIAATKVNFDGITYAKGASVLRQLVAWVGEQAFLKGLRTYFRRHEYGNTNLSDFLTALEEASGRDLKAWSKEWLETAGVNTLRPSFEIADGIYRSFAIGQEAAASHPTLRSHRVGVGLYDVEGGSLAPRRRIELDIVGERTPVPDLEGEKIPELLLLNDEDLTFSKVRLDERSFRTLVERLRLLADPLARALCWSSAWDMTRDAEIAARDYVELVMRNISGETEIGVVQTLLAQSASALNIYGDEANRSPGLDRIAAAGKDAITSNEAGGDHQLAWARAFISSAQSNAHLGFIRGLLDGTETVSGLKIDTDLRWHIVRSLAAAGAVEEDVIEAERERDPTDKGEREAAAARAARPTAAAKDEAWDAVADDPKLPYSMMRAMIGGFQQPGQRQLLEPYSARYFDALERIWADRPTEVALGFTTGLYPRVQVSQETVDATDRYLEERSPEPACRRLLIEGRDDVLRATRARARDAAAG